jgi:hypothetical protein
MPKPQRYVICARCQKEKRHHCKEMCQSCYGYTQRKHKIGHCNQCNREMTGVYSTGICSQCRVVNYKARKGREYLDKHAAVERNRRKRMGAEYNRRDRERNKQRRAYRVQYAHAYYQKNKEQHKQAHQEWRKANPGLRDLRKRRYNARKAGLEATLTPIEWQAIKDGFDHSCVYCNRRMERLFQEHIIPVMHGGHYTQYNIVPACQSCNARKQSSTGIEFLIRIAIEKQTGARLPGPSRNR